jgi:hypothetical protein
MADISGRAGRVPQGPVGQTFDQDGRPSGRRHSHDQGQRQKR